MLTLALHKKKLTSRPYIEKIVLHRRRRRMLPSRDFYSSLLLHRRRATIMYIQRLCRSPAGAWWLGINSGRTLQREVIQKTKKNSANLDLQTDGLIRKSGYLVQSPPSGVVRLALTDVQYDRPRQACSKSDDMRHDV